MCNRMYSQSHSIRLLYLPAIAEAIASAGGPLSYQPALPYPKLLHRCRRVRKALLAGRGMEKNVAIIACVTVDTL